MLEASLLHTEGRSSLFTKELTLHLPLFQLCSHLNLLKHQPLAFPLKTLLQSLCGCCAASGFPARRGVCCCPYKCHCSCCPLPASPGVSYSLPLPRPPQDRVWENHHIRDRVGPASFCLLFLFFSWFFSPPQPYGCRAETSLEQGDPPDPGEEGAPQRQSLSNCPTCSEAGACASESIPQWKSCCGTCAIQEHRAKMYGTGETSFPSPTPTSHSARPRSPQWGISLCFLTIPNILHHHLHSSHLTPPRPSDGCGTAFKNQQQHSEAVQHPGGWISTPWGGSTIQPQHGVQQGTPALPGE